MLLRFCQEEVKYDSSQDEEEQIRYFNKPMLLKTKEQMNSIYNNVWNPILMNNEAFNLLNDIPINTNENIKQVKDSKLCILINLCYETSQIFSLLFLERQFGYYMIITIIPNIQIFYFIKITNKFLI